jgi:hypothetical protein
MEKILLAIDAENLNVNTLDFACYVGSLTNSKITGIFLENTRNEKASAFTYLDGIPALDWEIDSRFEQTQIKQKRIDIQIGIFQNYCTKKGVRFEIHRDRGVPAKEMVYESRFADLMILDASTSFHKKLEGSPTEFARDILKDAECPVLIAPEKISGIDEVIFTYNGTKSSVFAIKQFTFSFPELADKNAIVLQVNEEGKWTGPDKYNLKEWIQNHYSAIGFEALKGNTEDKLSEYLAGRKNAFVVMGAYGRSNLSRIFKPSQADALIKIMPHPIFIAHY